LARIRGFVDTDLLKQIEKQFPETKGFTSASQTIDWAIRKLLSLADAKLPDQFILEKKKDVELSV